MVVKDILEAQFISQWHSNMYDSSKCDYYRNFKISFEPEKYLELVPANVYKIILKFRTCNHKLPIEVGRYANIERYLRICRHCTTNSVGDEYHYLFVCTHPDIVAARSVYLPHYYQANVCINNYFHLMQHLKTEHVIDYLSKFVKIMFDIVQ
jgi:hypothetical protein